ncbi:hypothetical protein CQW23_34585 [Capsicum baccatum]|uniref:BRCT domain-containing protein n=1 Tax=Capsicum baccatum TaxID=33114 RepID=A0A2G2UYK8_CAPBA|nr:hypothetical protein CQW23_34585 [Capsicum baccatum]
MGNVQRNAKALLSMRKMSFLIGEMTNFVVGLWRLGNYCFVLLNPKDDDGKTKSLLQDVLNIYSKELPDMNYAANTGKESPFLERCVLNGKYCTLVRRHRTSGGITPDDHLTSQFVEKNAEGATAVNLTYEEHTNRGISSRGTNFRIMLMNIADDNKKANLTKIIGDLGGDVTSDGCLSTHVVTGKVRKTLNFCSALCSGSVSSQHVVAATLMTFSSNLDY